MLRVLPVFPDLDCLFLAWVFHYRHHQVLDLCYDFLEFLPLAHPCDLVLSLQLLCQCSSHLLLFGSLDHLCCRISLDLLQFHPDLRPHRMSDRHVNLPYQVEYLRYLHLLHFHCHLRYHCISIVIYVITVAVAVTIALGKHVVAIGCNC